MKPELPVKPSARVRTQLLPQGPDVGAAAAALARLLARQAAAEHLLRLRGEADAA